MEQKGTSESEINREVNAVLARDGPSANDSDASTSDINVQNEQPNNTPDAPENVPESKEERDPSPKPTSSGTMKSNVTDADDEDDEPPSKIAAVVGTSVDGDNLSTDIESSPDQGDETESENDESVYEEEEATNGENGAAGQPGENNGAPGENNGDPGENNASVSEASVSELEDDESAEPSDGEDENTDVNAADNVPYKDSDWFKRMCKTCPICKTVHPTSAKAADCLLNKHRRLRCYLCFNFYRNDATLRLHFEENHRDAGCASDQVVCPYCPGRKLLVFDSVSDHVIRKHIGEGN